MELTVEITETVTYPVTIKVNERISVRIAKELATEEDPIDAQWFTQSDEAIIQRLIDAAVRDSDASINPTVEKRTWKIIGADHA